jgi:hypothetical protein
LQEKNTNLHKHGKEFSGKKVTKKGADVDKKRHFVDKPAFHVYERGFCVDA